MAEATTIGHRIHMRSPAMPLHIRQVEARSDSSDDSEARASFSRIGSATSSTGGANQSIMWQADIVSVREVTGDFFFAIHKPDSVGLLQRNVRR